VRGEAATGGDVSGGDELSAAPAGGEERDAGEGQAGSKCEAQEADGSSG
jgi:hypothetical protein